jgi:hypothetical protein
MTEPGLEGTTRSDGGDASVRKAAAEVANIEAETQKIRLETRFMARAHRLEWCKAIGSFGSFLTVAVALTGVYLTFRAQREQLASTEANHRDDAFVGLVKQFGDGTTPQSRLSAAMALGPYWRESKYRDQILTLFVSSIGTEREPAVRSALRVFLERNADSTSLAALADQNRTIQVQIAQIWDIPAELVSEFGPMRYRKDLHPHGDSVLGTLVQDLKWNIATLMGSVRTVRMITGLDFSRVIFSLMDIAPDKHGWDFVRTFTPEPDSGLVFKGVNFTSANFTDLTFVGATFNDTVLDSTLLFSTRFSHCHFAGTTSMAGFKLELLRVTGLYEDLTPISRFRVIIGPEFEDSDLDIATFYPTPHVFPLLGAGRDVRDHPGEFMGGAYYFSFANSSWRFRSPPDSLVVGPNLRFRQTGVRESYEYRGEDYRSSQHPR